MSLTGKPGLTQLALLAPARWGFGAVASTSNLNVITSGAGSITDPLWNHTSTTWLRNVGLTILLAVIFTLLVWIRLHRSSLSHRR